MFANTHLEESAQMRPTTTFLLAILLISLAPPFPLSDAQQVGYNCTLVLGYSQVANWYISGSFESYVNNATWQLKWMNGAGVEVWGRASLNINSVTTSSPCTNNSTTPDRVVYSVSGGQGNNVSEWVEGIKNVTANINADLPSVRLILLQPVVGGVGSDTNTFLHAWGVQACPNPPNDYTNGVRASRQYPFILQAINIVAGESSIDDVIVGAVTEVRDCADYADSTGHLATQARPYFGQWFGNYYTALDAGLPQQLSVQASANSLTGVTPLTVQFSSTITGGVQPYTFFWNFSDGGISDLQNPSHIYGIGNYTAKLRVTDSVGSMSNVQVGPIVVTAQPPPSPVTWYRFTDSGDGRCRASRWDGAFRIVSACYIEQTQVYPISPVPNPATWYRGSLSGGRCLVTSLYNGVNGSITVDACYVDSTILIP